jgi:hypothetical protein
MIVAGVGQRCEGVVRRVSIPCNGMEEFVLHGERKLVARAGSAKYRNATDGAKIYGRGPPNSSSAALAVLNSRTQI